MPDQQEKLRFVGYEAEPQNRLPKFSEVSFPEELRIDKVAFKLAPILVGLGAMIDYFSLMPYIDPMNFFLLPPMAGILHTLITDKKTGSNKSLRKVLLAAYGLCISLIIATSLIFLMPIWEMVFYIIYPSLAHGGRGIDSTTIILLIIWLILLVVFGQRLKRIRKKIIEKQ